MLRQKEINVNGVKVRAFSLSLQHGMLLIAIAPKGFVMCGYLDINTAEKIKDAACVVTGVTTIEELLQKPVVRLTAQAQALGVACGMSGREALEKIIDKIEKKWEKIDSYSADVYMRVHSSDVIISEIRGKYYFKRPLKTRTKILVTGMDGAINMTDLFVDNGKSYWQVIFSPKGKILSVEKNERTVSEMLSGMLKDKFKVYSGNVEFDLRKYFKVLRSEKYYPKSLEKKVWNGKQTYVLRMRLDEYIQRDIIRKMWRIGMPRNYNLAPKDILFYFNESDFLFRKIEFTSLFDNSVFSQLTYSNIRINNSMEDSLFEYIPPSGVWIKDDRALQKREETYNDQIHSSSIRLLNKECPFSFPVLFDRYHEIFDGKFSVKSVPVSFFVDKQGVIRDIHFGYARDIDKFFIEKIKELKNK